MNTVEEELAYWRASLVKNIPVAGLITRNPVVYKWKAAWRCWVLREAGFWRITDLLTQSLALHRQGHNLGARILLRSSFETLATLIYLNHNIRAVITERLDFHEFSKMTTRQVGGSKNREDGPDAVNVLTMLEKCENAYPGMRSIYDSLSESAHPNFEGLVWGYSKVNHELHETDFGNRWSELHGETHLGSMELCMLTFFHEYDTVWYQLIQELETWIAENDKTLEATKPIPD